MSSFYCLNFIFNTMPAHKLYFILYITINISVLSEQKLFVNTLLNQNSFVVFKNCNHFFTCCYYI